MTNRVLLKKSAVSARVPLTTDLAFGEIAINYADGLLYFKNSLSVINSFTSYPTPTTSSTYLQWTGSAYTWATVSGGTVTSVTSVAELTLGTTGTDITSPVATGTTTPVITLNVPTASAANRGALSAADWTTFNGKQAAGSYLTASTGVTSVGGTGTVSGLTLTGSVTTTGSLTLGGTLSLGSLNTLGTAAGLSTTLPIASGGTGQTTNGAAYTSLVGYTSVATASGTTILDNTSENLYYFTGTLSQTITLPVVTTLLLGWTFNITNNSTTGLLTINSSGGDLVLTILSGMTAMITCIDIATNTTATAWDYGYTDFTSLTGTGANVLATSPTITGAILNSTTSYDATTGTAPFTVASTTPVDNLSIGGTAASATSLSGGVLGAVPYQSGTGATAMTGVGTVGQLLTSAGAAAPAWTTPTLMNLPSAWVKKAADCATTTDITLNTVQTTIDGIAITATTRVLVKNQASLAQNGIYTGMSTTTWVRDTDAATSGDITGATISVDAGTTQFGQLWTNNFQPTDTLGTTSMNWYRILDTSQSVGAELPPPIGTMMALSNNWNTF